MELPVAENQDQNKRINTSDVTYHTNQEMLMSRKTISLYFVESIVKIPE